MLSKNLSMKLQCFRVSYPSYWWGFLNLPWVSQIPLRVSPTNQILFNFFTTRKITSYKEKSISHLEKKRRVCLSHKIRNVRLNSKMRKVCVSRKMRMISPSHKIGEVCLNCKMRRVCLSGRMRNACLSCKIRRICPQIEKYVSTAKCERLISAPMRRSLNR